MESIQFEQFSLCSGLSWRFPVYTELHWDRDRTDKPAEEHLLLLRQHPLLGGGPGGEHLGHCHHPEEGEDGDPPPDSLRLCGQHHLFQPRGFQVQLLRHPHGQNVTSHHFINLSLYSGLANCSVNLPGLQLALAVGSVPSTSSPCVQWPHGTGDIYFLQRKNQ